MRYDECTSSAARLRLSQRSCSPWWVSLGGLASNGTKVIEFAQLVLGHPVKVADNVIIGTDITGHQDISVTTVPGQVGDVVGGETNTTVCPGSISPGQSVIGTRIGPDGSLHVGVTANGGSGGSVTGFRSTLTVGGGPGCN
jgi:hypothetical protein